MKKLENETTSTHITPYPFHHFALCTIWWQPDIKTDAQGKAKVEFFNNSTSEEMYLSVEGMTPDGKLLVNE